MADQGSGDSGSKPSKPAPPPQTQKIQIVKLAPKKILKKSKGDKPTKGGKL
jgi:hypothetical protein